MEKLYNEQVTEFKLFGIKFAEIKKVTREAMEDNISTFNYVVTPEHYNEEFNVND